MQRVLSKRPYEGTETRSAGAPGVLDRRQLEFQRVEVMEGRLRRRRGGVGAEVVDQQVEPAAAVGHGRGEDLDAALMEGRDEAVDIAVAAGSLADVTVRIERDRMVAVIAMKGPRHPTSVPYRQIRVTPALISGRRLGGHTGGSCRQKG